MSLSSEGAEAVAYVRRLKTEQEAVILAGQFTRIEEYRAACAVVRNLNRIATNIESIFEGKEAAQVAADDALQPMPEDN